jgi:hypothetical protein
MMQQKHIFEDNYTDNPPMVIIHVSPHSYIILRQYF